MKALILIAKLLVVIILFISACVALKKSSTMVYSIEENPSKLLISKDGKVLDFGIETNTVEFTISQDCRLILSTFSKGREAFVQVTDMHRSGHGNHGQLDAIWLASTFFKDEDIIYFSKPSFSPDNEKFVVTGLHPGGMKSLFFSDGKTHGWSVASWLEDVIREVRWVDNNSVILELIGNSDYVYYLRVNSEGQTSEALRKDFDKLPKSESYSRVAPLNARRALECSPSYKEGDD